MTGGQRLTAQDFDIRPMERAKHNNKQTYIVKLHHPIPDGRVLILRLRLSDEPGLDEPSFEARLRSAVPFTVTSVKCGGGLERDTIDNVKGVPGIGEKGARDLISQYGSLESLLSRAGVVRQKKYREALLGHREEALQSLDQLNIRTDVPIDVDLQSLRYRGPSREACFELFS